ncbi:glycine cleavage system protein H [Dehalobacter sp. DCM]|uniref:putative zinc-binding protein n=1 Tax=Dehalobacter sp. DCM TaxID=2907827 RepID=UPI0030814C02|nr:glycine cleavage system protein H [Dehalobacter sp. DCM]
MSKSYAILPCNGLDKPAGCLSKELALQIKEQTESSEIICPTFVRVSDAPYRKILDEKELLVIDGCGTRCAGKLAAEKGWKIAAKVNVSDESKKYGISLGTSLRVEEDGLRLCGQIINNLLQEQTTPESNTGAASGEGVADAWFPQSLAYETYHKDKFIFRLPKNENFYFNENDCWAYVSGHKARIGVTDFVQKSLSDIMFFTPPGLGITVEQFEDAGSIESGKAVYEIICPVSGKFTAVNYELLDHPEYINENPYEKGWIAEVELSDFPSDQELLLQFDGYFEVMKRKVDEFHV